MGKKLERCVAKVGRKAKRKGKKVNPYAVCKARLFPLRRTSFNAGHIHFWRESNKFTTFNSGHKHKLNRSRKLAMQNHPGGHTHKLLRTKKK